jgi:hypothetical protein
MTVYPNPENTLLEFKFLVIKQAFGAEFEVDLIPRRLFAPSPKAITICFLTG